MARTQQIRILGPLAACLLGIACGPTYPNCEEDGDCKSGEFCVNQRCQLCRDDGDCEQGQSCNGGRCDDIVGYCDTAGDCPDGQECQGNRCVAPLQSRDGDGTGAAGECELQSISFGFDADELDPSARSTAQANLRCMRDRGIEGVHLTGHADPRGTEEYNLALGDRRAHAVADYLSSLGLSSEATSTSSMGEEMARGTDEASYAKDRRVDIRAK